MMGTINWYVWGTMDGGRLPLQAWIITLWHWKAGSRGGPTTKVCLLSTNKTRQSKSPWPKHWPMNEKSQLSYTFKSPLLILIIGSTYLWGKWGEMIWTSLQAYYSHLFNTSKKVCLSSYRSTPCVNQCLTWMRWEGTVTTATDSDDLSKARNP